MTNFAGLFPPGMQVFERGWLSSNNILLTGDNDIALVDSGYCKHAALTRQLVRSAIGDRALTTLVNTHLHSDHCGGNAALQAAYDSARTWVPPGVANAVRVWDEDALTYRPTGQECPRFQLDSVLKAGTSMRLGQCDWQVLSAPGHDPHSVILFEPRTRTLISADALWGNGFGVVFQELEGDEAFDEVEATLDLIEQLAPLVVVPGHGAVFTDVPGALARARSRLDVFRADPRKHAAHAAKVLLKFRLLDVERLAFGDLLAWAERTTYFSMVHHRWFPAEPFQRWISHLTDELVRVGAAHRDTEHVTNV